MEIDAIHNDIFYSIFDSLWSMYILKRSLEIFESIKSNLSSSIYFDSMF